MDRRKLFVYNEKVESTAKKAKISGSIEELGSLCMHMNVADSIYLGKMNLWLARQSLSTVYRTLKKYPHLREKINYFGTLKGFKIQKDSLFKLLNPQCDVKFYEEVKKITDKLVIDCYEKFKNENGIAIAFIVGAKPHVMSGIIVNGKTMLEKDILKHLEYSESIGFYPKGCNTIKSVIDHEIGHILDFTLDISTSKKYIAILKKYTVEEIGKHLSQYSISGNVVNYREVFAEAYSEYSNNSNPRNIAFEIGNLVQEIYDKTYHR